MNPFVRESLGHKSAPIIPASSEIKSVFSIYLDTWAKGRFDFTNYESSSLYNLAAQRPAIYGDAVYTARVMIGDEGISTESYRISNPDNNLVSSIGKIYPNPTKDEAYLDYQLKEGQKGVIDIYSITGQLLYEKALIIGNSKLIISTSNLNSGLYFYKVIVDDAIIANEKLIIIK